MHRYTINSECGLMSDFYAINIDTAKSLYRSVYHYDFDSCTDYDGSWYWIIEDDVVVESAHQE